MLHNWNKKSQKSATARSKIENLPKPTLLPREEGSACLACLLFDTAGEEA
jgi:hypothetical protein